MASLVLNIVLGSILTALAIAFVVRWLFRVDERIEDYRRAAAQLSNALSGLGLVKIPAFLVSFSVGDYSAMGESICELVKLFASGNQFVIDEFKVVFDRVLDAKLLSEEGRAYIAAKLVAAENGAKTEKTLVNP